MKQRGSSGRAIAAVSRTPGTITLDVILPMGTKDNGTRGSISGGTIHTKRVELVKLGPFGLLPQRPGVQGLELPTGEGAESLFLRSSSLGADGMDEGLNFGVTDSVLGDIQLGVNGMGNDSQQGDGNIGDMLNVVMSGKTIRIEESRDRIGSLFITLVIISGSWRCSLIVRSVDAVLHEVGAQLMGGEATLGG